MIQYLFVDMNLNSSTNGGYKGEMDCFNCGNCKENQLTYYCLARNEVVLNMDYKAKEKTRTGWKKKVIENMKFIEENLEKK